MLQEAKNEADEVSSNQHLLRYAFGASLGSLRQRNLLWHSLSTVPGYSHHLTRTPSGPPWGKQAGHPRRSLR